MSSSQITVLLEGPVLKILVSVKIGTILINETFIQLASVQINIVKKAAFLVVNVIEKTPLIVFNRFLNRLSRFKISQHVRFHCTYFIELLCVQNLVANRQKGIKKKDLFNTNFNTYLNGFHEEYLILLRPIQYGPYSTLHRFH